MNWPISTRSPGGPGTAPTEIVVVDGRPASGRPTLLRAWADRRAARRGHGAAGVVRPARPLLPLDALLSALSALLRGSVPTPPPTCSAPTRRYWRRCSASVAWASRGRADAGRQHARPGGAVRGPGPGARPAGRAGAAGRGDRRRASGRPAPWPTGCASCGARTCRSRSSSRVRSGEGQPMPATASIHLDALGRDAAAELVGRPGSTSCTRGQGPPAVPDRAGPGGPRAELPASLVESVSARCDELGPAGLLLRTAAVIGPELDIELLAAVLGRPVVDAARRRRARRGQAVPGRTTTVPSGSVTNWSARRWPRARPRGGPRCCTGRRAACSTGAPTPTRLTVAGHARLGGDLVLAARALREASAQAAERFDHAAAEALLDDALRLSPGRRTVARAGPGPHPARGVTARPWQTSSGPRAAPGRPRWRSAPGPPTSTASFAQAPSSPRTARSPRRTRPPGPGAWRSAAGPGTRPVTWPRPSCCSARRSRWPRARTG